MPNDLSEETTSAILTVVIVIIVGTMSVFGIAANVFILLVFCKQGFSETVNISCTALTLADVLSLISSLLLSIFWNPWFLHSGLPLHLLDIQVVFGTLPYGCFSRITGIVTAFITLERCLCVTWPLKVKQILTSKVIVTFTVVIYLTMFSTMVPIYSVSLLGWLFEPRTNKTILGALTVANTGAVSNISYALHAAIQLFSFLAVLVCTAVLALRLRQKTRWRSQQGTAQNAMKNATKRQDKAIKMVALIATIYIVCYIPTILFLIVTTSDAGFNSKGRYKNVFYVTWSFVIVFCVLNSTTNIFVYYFMSSKFKKTCHQILTR